MMAVEEQTTTAPVTEWTYRSDDDRRCAVDNCCANGAPSEASSLHRFMAKTGLP
jgi:hypothetical protein